MAHADDLDIIVLESSLFYQNQNQELPLTIAVEKIREILETYQCFKDDGNSVPKHYYKMIHAKQFTSRHNTHQHQRKPKNLSYAEKVKRETIALLNKLSNTNATNICEKLIKYCDESNVGFISDMVLAKCYKQSYYLNLYFGLLQQLRTKHFEKVNDALVTFTQNVMEKVLEDVESIASLDQTNYDQFCLFVLQKREFCQKHALLVMFDEKGMIDYNSVDHYKCLERVLISSSDSTSIDIVISVFQELLRINKIAVAWISSLNELYKTRLHNAPFLLNKTKFMIYNIIDKDK